MNEITTTDDQGFLIINTLQDALKVAAIIADSSFCPKQFVGKPGDVLVCMQMGKEVGLKPLQALQNIAVINGRPTLWGDAMLAVCRQAANFEYVDETLDRKQMIATCRAKRHSEPEVVRTFSQEDAKKAGLWGKQGPWSAYPDRMLQMRARGFALRDAFADTLRGIMPAEEVSDYEIEKPRKPDHVRQAEKAKANMPQEKDVVDLSQETGELISEQELSALITKIGIANASAENVCKRLNIPSLNLMLKSSLSKVLEKLEKQIEIIEADKKLDTEQAGVVTEFFQGAES